MDPHWSEEGNSKSARNYAYSKCEKNTLKVVRQEENLCDEVETATDVAHLSDMESGGGACEAVETSRTRCSWDKFREWGSNWHGKRFPLSAK